MKRRQHPLDDADIVMLDSAGTPALSSVSIIMRLLQSELQQIRKTAPRLTMIKGEKNNDSNAGPSGTHGKQDRRFNR